MGDTNSVLQEKEDLEKIKEGNWRTPLETMKSLVAMEGYTQVRFYCHKPSVGRTIDIATTNDSKVLDFFLQSKDNVDSCGSYYRLPADNSYVSKDCSSWKGGKWYPAFYNVPFYIYAANYFAINHDGRWECDDYDPQKSSTDGSWVYYVR